MAHRGRRTPRQKRSWAMLTAGDTNRIDNFLTVVTEPNLGAGMVRFGSFVGEAFDQDRTLARSFIFGIVKRNGTPPTPLVNLAVGMAIVSPGEPAVDLISDANWDGWMFHRVLTFRDDTIEQSADNTVARITSTLAAGLDFRADVKAQRKIP